MTLQYCSDRVSEESASHSQNASSCDVYCGILQANGRRRWTPQCALSGNHAYVKTLYDVWIPEFGSGMDPDPAGSENCGSGAPLVPVPCENGSVETTVAEGGQNLVAGLWGRTLGQS